MPTERHEGVPYRLLFVYSTSSDHQAFRAVDAEDEDLLDVGRAAGTGHQDEFAPQGARRQRPAIAVQAAGRCSASWATRPTTTQAGGR